MLNMGLPIEMRRTRSTHGSLELLLDTITNTFGGVLFLAILVAMLLQFSSSEADTSAPEPVDLVELAELRDDLTSARAELKSWQRAVAAQAAMRKTVAPAGLETELARVDELSSRRNELLDQRLLLLQQIGDGRATTGQIQAELLSLDESLASARTKIEQGKAALASEMKTRTRTARLPSVHLTLKTGFVLVMRYGRLYTVYEPGRDSPYARLNLDDFVVVKDADQIHVTPKPYAGIIANEDENFRTALLEALTGIDPGGYYLAIGVWEDSFDRFGSLKNVLVDMGFEYRLIPMEEEGFLVESSKARPLVQ